MIECCVCCRIPLVIRASASQMKLWSCQLNATEGFVITCPWHSDTMQRPDQLGASFSEVVLCSAEVIRVGRVADVWFRVNELVSTLLCV